MQNKKYETTLNEEVTRRLAINSDKKADEFPDAKAEEGSEMGNEVPVFKANVTKFPQSNVKKDKGMYETEGIIYEVAEQLYLRESAEAMLKAKEEPPVHKVLTKSEEKAILNATTTKPNADGAYSGDKEETNRTIKTGGAFWFQFAMMIPVINLITALVFCAGQKFNPNYRAMARANLIWLCIGCIFIAAAASFAVYSGLTVEKMLPAVWLGV